MTDNDKLILDALRIQPMTGSEIGKGFAPEHIKDRAAWGRKWLAKNAAAVAALTAADAPVVVEHKDTGIDFTVWSTLLDYIRVPSIFYVSYKHILAPRGTPPRPHFPRATRAFRFCNI